MYAVVSSGGKQYRVEPGATLTMERLGAEPGAPVTFDRVLLIGDGDTVTVGTPVVDGASVSGTVLAEELGPKLVIFKFKQKVKYRRRTGHRQHLVRIRIDAINADGRSTRAEAPVAEKAEPKARRPRASAKAKVEAPETAEAEAPAPVEEKPKRTSRTTKAADAKAATDGTQKGRQQQQERPRFGRQAPGGQARRRAARAVRHHHRPPARQHLQPRRQRRHGA
jgi:large subunit ribosomal protein L21